MDVKKAFSEYEQDNNFVEVIRAPAADAAQFQTKACRSMFDWWHAFAPDGPRYEAFDIVEHVDKAANLFLVAVLPDGEFEYRLHGDEVRRILGYNCAGTVFSETRGTKDLRGFANFLKQLCEEKTAFHSRGTLKDYGKSYLKFESFDFVLTDDQDTPTHIIGVLVLNG